MIGSQRAWRPVLDPPRCEHTGKASLRSRAKARRLATAQRGVARKPLYAYLCICGWWHITSSAPRQRDGVA